MSQLLCKVFTFALVVVAFVAIPLQTNAACNSCGVNSGIACINETSFLMCYNGDPDFSSPPMTCPGGKICTRLSEKCVEPGMGVKPDCDPTGLGCGKCDGVKMFACTSRTTFAQCDGEQLTNVTGLCPPTYTCDSASKEICVNKCTTLTSIECDRDAPL